MIVRNDDVAADTNLAHLRAFCELCDTRGVQVVHAITPMGVCIPVDHDMTNAEIVSLQVGRAINSVVQRPDLIQFLRRRTDLIAVHGLYHTHEPCPHDILTAADILLSVGLSPTWFVPPFNEGAYGQEVCGLKVSADDAEQLESCAAVGRRPSQEIGYLHSWRFDPECSRPYIHPKLRRQLTLADLGAVL